MLTCFLSWVKRKVKKGMQNLIFLCKNQILKKTSRRGSHIKNQVIKSEQFYYMAKSPRGQVCNAT